LYKYLYLDKLKPEGEQSGDMAFGSALHLGLQTTLTMGDSSKGVEAFSTYWWLQTTKRLKYTRYGASELQEMGEVFLSRFARLHAKKIKPHQMEVRLYGEYAGIKLEGTPDVVGEFEGVPSIIDFKTSGYPYNKARTITSEQMMLYAHLTNNPAIRQVVYIVFVKGREPRIQILKRPFSDSELKAALDNIVVQAKELDNKVVFSQNRNGCGYQGGLCPFPELCYPELTKEEINEIK
jgi:hypothetical protein